MSQALNVVHAANRSARHCACASLHSFRFALASSRERSSRRGTEREASTARSSSHPRNVRLRVSCHFPSPSCSPPGLVFSLFLFLSRSRFFRSLSTRASLFFSRSPIFHYNHIFLYFPFLRLRHNSTIFSFILLCVHFEALERASYFFFYYFFLLLSSDMMRTRHNFARQKKFSGA